MAELVGEVFLSILAGLLEGASRKAWAIALAMIAVLVGIVLVVNA